MHYNLDTNTTNSLVENVLNLRIPLSSKYTTLKNKDIFLAYQQEQHEHNNKYKNTLNDNKTTTTSVEAATLTTP
jgi:hypothetical protein